MRELFAALRTQMQAGRDTILATVVSNRGSTPRGAGAQMLVGQNGLLCGTIGGGPGELEATKLSAKLLARQASDSHQYILQQNPTEDIGAVCGGDLTAWFQYIAADDAVWRALSDTLLRRLAENRGGWLLLHQGGAPALLDDAGQLLVGSAPEDAQLLLSPVCCLREAFFSLPLPVGERAIVFGGGHCSAALVPVLHSVGFRVTVFDCRPEYASPDRFPQAEQVICADYTHVQDCLPLRDGDYVVIMTTGHSYDYTVERQVLQWGRAAYVGVIGSRTKTASVNGRLRQAGIPEAAIAAVHAPIGTAIKAVTPAEIAVSIAGEMILVRAEHREAAGGPIVHGCPMG